MMALVENLAVHDVLPAIPLGFESIRETRHDENTRVQTKAGTFCPGTIVYEIFPTHSTWLLSKYSIA